MPKLQIDAWDTEQFIEDQIDMENAFVGPLRHAYPLLQIHSHSPLELEKDATSSITC